jgi:hypothetical protein
LIEQFGIQGYWLPGAAMECKCGAANCSKFLVAARAFWDVGLIHFDWVGDVC